jgi:hypothetical protein
MSKTILIALYVLIIPATVAHIDNCYDTTPSASEKVYTFGEGTSLVSVVWPLYWTYYISDIVIQGNTCPHNKGN